jgi:hypothetical protein
VLEADAEARRYAEQRVLGITRKAFARMQHL